MARPKQQFRKIEPPHIRLYEDTIQWFKSFHEETGIPLAELYQEACDNYIRKEERKKKVITL